MTEPGHRSSTSSGVSALWSWIIAGVVVVALGLLVAVVIIGLKRDQLDVTGVAAVLSTLISGVVLGTVLKDRGAK